LSAARRVALDKRVKAALLLPRRVVLRAVDALRLEASNAAQAVRPAAREQHPLPPLGTFRAAVLAGPPPPAEASLLLAALSAAPPARAAEAAVEIAPTLPLRAVIAAEAAVAAGQVPRVAARLPVDGPEVIVAVATAATPLPRADTAAEAAAEVAGRHPQAAAVDGALLHLRAAVADAVHLPHRVAEATRAGGKIQFSF
jgi:hypothetical protein